MSPPSCRITLVSCAVSALFFSLGCSYDESTIPNATLTCTTADGCPAGYACVPLGSGAVCCKDGDCGKAADAAADLRAENDARAEAGRDLARATDAGGPDADRSEGPAGDAAGDHPAAEPPADATGASDTGDGPAVHPDAPAVDVPPDLVDARELDTASPPDVMSAPCPTPGRGPAMVWIESAKFCVDATEVTNGQYQTFLDAVKNDPIPFLVALPSSCRKDGWKSSFTPDTALTPWPQPTRADNPVISVDWCDAWAFCQWAGKRLCGQRGGGPLLHGGGEPSDEFSSAGNFLVSEWAYACTAAGSRLYPYGNAYNQKSCNTGRTGAASESYLLTKPAGSSATCEGGYPGLFDLSGNVEEWVDGCTASNGPDDKCAVVGGSLFAQSAGAAADETGCATGVYATARNEAYQLRGFRCCAN